MAVKASLELAIVGVKDLCVYQFHHLTIFVKFHKSGAAPLSTTPETIYTIGITVKKRALQVITIAASGHVLH